MKDAKIALTIRVKPEVYEQMKNRRHETGVSFQEAGALCLEAWAYGKMMEPELDSYHRFLKKAPRALLNVVKLLVDYVNVSVRP